MENNTEQKEEQKEEVKIQINQNEESNEITFEKLKEAINNFDEKSKRIIIQILKLKKKIDMKFDIFNKNNLEIKEKAENTNNQLHSNKEGENKNKTHIMNVTDIRSNQKSETIHENMIVSFNNVSKNISLFTKLFESKIYNEILSEYENNNSQNVIDTEEMKKNLEELEKNIKLKVTKKIKKKKILDKTKTFTKKMLLKKLAIPKDKRLGETNKKKKKRPDVELLDVLQKEFPDNSYIQKISKTFLQRRLFKTIIYKHIFKYVPDEVQDEKKLSSGESTVYKYGKFIFKFNNEELFKENGDKLIEAIGKELKQQFILKDVQNNCYEISGRIILGINEFLEKVFKTNLFKEYGIIEATCLFYEFFEELVGEFENYKNNENMRIGFCDEALFKNLIDEWHSLQKAREFIEKIRSNQGNKEDNLKIEINNQQEIK